MPDILIDGSTRHIFVVDDHSSSANLLAMLLKRAGHKVSVFYNAVDALHALEQICPDVMFLDMEMQGLSGRQALRQIRARPQNDHLKIVALTAAEFGDELDGNDLAGFDHILIKPADIEEISRILASCGPVSSAEA